MIYAFEMLADISAIQYSYLKFNKLNISIKFQLYKAFLIHYMAHIQNNFHPSKSLFDYIYYYHFSIYLMPIFLLLIFVLDRILSNFLSFL
ncbi:unnamed protein product [Meloidogyne enterolobii]|uniref:Uncharacterized protein n=1 Tax=Meloidogyne enterolobii TaxID=390850 RepID=A0ACB1AVE1_MELEN